MGTHAWRNWRASLQPTTEIPARYEDAIYSDARFLGERLELGPYTILPTFASTAPMPVALVLRCEMRRSLEPGLIDHTTGKLLPADSSGYHGGTVSDELAALLSLALGVRCRAGGTVRVWGLPDDDPAGYPMELDRQHLSRPGPPGLEVLPNVVRQVEFADASDLLSTFPHLGSEDASALARAARLYANALWWANEDTNFAWLQMVGAVEAAAARRNEAGQQPLSTLEELQPRLWEALDGAPEETKQKVEELVVRPSSATRKFLGFVENFAPRAPQPRPAFGLDWTRLRKHLGIIYDHRSRALHDGRPFPHPMLDKPMQGPDGQPSEVPVGMSATAKGSSWMAKEMPMLLHTFEYVARGALLNWWHDLAPVVKSQPS